MNIAALLAGLFSGIIGSMGMGGGAVLIIYFAVFTQTEQLKAQGINLIFFIPIAAVALIIYAIKKKIKWKTVITLAALALCGAAIGFFLTSLFNPKYISFLFGAFLIILGIKELFSKNKDNAIAKKEKE